MATEIHKAKKTKKQRKYGRNANFCLRYRNSNKRERNKVIKLKKHLGNFPNDAVAQSALKVCYQAIGISH